MAKLTNRRMNGQSDYHLPSLQRQWRKVLLHFQRPQAHFCYGRGSSFYLRSSWGWLCIQNLCINQSYRPSSLSAIHNLLAVSIRGISKSAMADCSNKTSMFNSQPEFFEKILYTERILAHWSYTGLSPMRSRFDTLSHHMRWFVTIWTGVFPGLLVFSPKVKPQK